MRVSIDSACGEGYFTLEPYKGSGVVSEGTAEVQNLKLHILVVQITPHRLREYRLILLVTKSILFLSLIELNLIRRLSHEEGMNMLPFF